MIYINTNLCKETDSFHAFCCMHTTVGNEMASQVWCHEVVQRPVDSRMHWLHPHPWRGPDGEGQDRWAWPSTMKKLFRRFANLGHESGSFYMACQCVTIQFGLIWFGLVAQGPPGPSCAKHRVKCVTIQQSSRPHPVCCS